MANEIPFAAPGNVTADPEARVTGTGKAMATFTLASTERKFDRSTNQFEDGDTSYFNVAVYGAQADRVLNGLRRGSRAIVVGTLRIRNFERKDGSKGSSADVNATEVGGSFLFAPKNAGGYGGQQQGGYQNSGYQNGGQQGGYQQPQNQQASQDPWATGPAPQDQAAQSDPFANSAPPADSYADQSGPPQDDAFGGW